MHRFRAIGLSAVLTLAISGPAFAQQQATGATAQVTDAPTTQGAKPGAVAYPNNPAGTPVAGDKGAPVVTDKAACPTPGNGRCPDRPAPSGSASEGSPASKGSETANQ